MSYTPKKCSFCGRPIPLGNGIMYVRNDAVTFWYCSTKCRKNAMVLKRDPRKLKWARSSTKGKIQRSPGFVQSKTPNQTARA